MSDLRVAFITVGDTRRLTGGYLYHVRVFAALRARGIALTEIVASEAALFAQLSRATCFGEEFDPRRFDVIVVDALARAVCAPWLDSWRALRPIVAMVHELPSVAEGNGEAALEAPLLRSDLLIAVSAHGQAVLERRGVSPERIRIVSPGCDRLQAPGHLAPGAAQAGDLRSSAAGRQPAVALCVAQWIRRKGILTLVEAWSSEPRWPALLELIGETDADPAYAAEVHAAIARSPAEAPILVRGPVDDEALIRAYQNATLFVLPSTFEGYGMVYAEALSFGLPIVACNTGPIPDLIGDAGLLAPPNAPAALADALARLLSDAGLRARLARAARSRSRMLPTWEHASQRFQGVLQEAIVARR